MVRSPSCRTQSVCFYRHFSAFLTASVLLMGASSVWAQDARLPPLTVAGELLDEPTPGLELTKPAATGSRLDLTPLETPASVEVISGEKIRERGQHNVNEAVSRATGFTTLAAPGNGGTSLGVRGFTGHSSVMQLYDGTQLYVASGTVTFPFDTWAVDRVEVLRGPASVMYGNGAIGGVLNVIPRKPTGSFENEALLEFDSNLTRRAAATSGGPLGGKVSYRANVSGKTSDGWVDRGDNENMALSVALRTDVSESFTATVSHDYGYQQPLRYFGTPLVNGLLNEEFRKKNFNVSDSLIEYRDNWSQLKLEWQAADNIKLNSISYLLGSDRHWRDAENYTFVPATGLVTRSSYLEILHDQQQYGNRSDVAIDYDLLGMKNQTVVGFDVNRIDFTHVNNGSNAFSSTVNPGGFDPGLFGNTSATANAFISRFSSQTDQYAVFAEDRLQVTDWWSLIGGGRVDNITMARTDHVTPANSFSKDFHSTSYRVGTVVNIARDTALYGQYATAADPVGGLITVSNANVNFDLATGEQIEAGVKQSFWDGRGEWTFAGYQIVKKSILTQNPATTLTEQVGQQSSRGVEATLGFRVGDFDIEANLALLDVRFDSFRSGGVTFDGKRPPQVPEQLANLWLGWRFAPQWKALSALRWVGPTYSDNANTQKRSGYSIVDLGVEWSPVERVSVGLRVLNAFDEVYAISSSGTTQWLLGAPRTALLTTTVKF